MGKIGESALMHMYMYTGLYKASYSLKHLFCYAGLCVFCFLPKKLCYWRFIIDEIVRVRPLKWPRAKYAWGQGSEIKQSIFSLPCFLPKKLCYWTFIIDEIVRVRPLKWPRALYAWGQGREEKPSIFSYSPHIKQFPMYPSKNCTSIRITLALALTVTLTLIGEHRSRITIKCLPFYGRKNSKKS